MRNVRRLVFGVVITAAATAAASSRAAWAQEADAPARPRPSPRVVAAERAGRARAVHAIRAALQAGDHAAFRRWVTRAMLARHAADFDAWFAAWRDAARARPESLEAITLRHEDGRWKLDEN